MGGGGWGGGALTLLPLLLRWSIVTVTSTLAGVITAVCTLCPRLSCLALLRGSLELYHRCCWGALLELTSLQLQSDASRFIVVSLSYVPVLLMGCAS